MFFLFFILSVFFSLFLKCRFALQWWRHTPKRSESVTGAQVALWRSQESAIAARVQFRVRERAPCSGKPDVLPYSSFTLRTGFLVVRESRSSAYSARASNPSSVLHNPTRTA